MTSFVSNPQTWNFQTQIELLEHKRLILEEQEHEAYCDELGLNGVEKMEDRGYADNQTQASPSGATRRYFRSTIHLNTGLKLELHDGGDIVIGIDGKYILLREEELAQILQICYLLRDYKSEQALPRSLRAEDRIKDGSGSL